MNLKRFTKKAVSFLLAATMALSAIMASGGGTVTVEAALSDKLGGLNGLDEEGQKISDQITTANIYSYIKKQGIQPEFSPNLTKQVKGDTIYEWAYDHKADDTNWSDLTGGSYSTGSIYSKTITAGTEYWVKYPNVEVNGNRYTIKIAVSFDSAYKQKWDASSSSKGDDGGPYVAFFPASPGSIRFSHYSRANCSISVYDTGNAESFSGNDVEMIINFMDIDCMQSMSFASDSDVAMIQGGILGSGLNISTPDITDGAKDNGYTNANFKKHVTDHLNEVATRTVFTKTSGNANDSAGNAKYALKVQAKFTPAKHTLNYYFNAGSEGVAYNWRGCPSDTGSSDFSSSNCGYGSQDSGVFMFFGTAADSEVTPQEYAPDITKTVLDGNSYGKAHVMASGGEEIVYHLSFGSAGWAKDLTSVSVTDSLDSCLSMVDGSFKVTSSASGNVTSLFKNNSSGNSLNFDTASATAASTIGGTQATYTIEYKAKIKEGCDLSAHGHLTNHVNSGKDGYAEIPNTASIRIAGEHVKAGKETATSETVYVYWKPANRPDPVKTVDKETLKNADETFTYSIKQTMPANTWSFGYLDSFVITDQIDSCLEIEEVKIYQDNDSKDVTAKFDIQKNNNKIVASAKSETLNSNFLTGNGTEKAFIMKVKVHYNKAYAYRLEHINQNAYETAHRGSLTDGTSYDHVDSGETKVSTKNNAEVSIQWDKWGDGWTDGNGGTKKIITQTVKTDSDIPVMEHPTKTVTDDDAGNDERKGIYNVLTDANEVWIYTIKQTIPENTASIYRYSSFKIEDQIDTCLTIGNKVTDSENQLKDIHVTITPKGGSAFTLNRNDVAVTEENNKLVLTPSAELLQGGSGSTDMDNVFYGGADLRGATITVTVPVHIYSGGDHEGGSQATNQAVLDKIREHGHMHETEDGTEEYMIFENEASVIVDDMLNRTGDSNEGTVATLKTGKVTTKLMVPRIKDPVKNVYDTDDLNWDHEVGKGNETSVDPLSVSRDKNRVSDSTKEWYYVINQNIPKRSVNLFYYKTFKVTDQVDSCLAYDTADVKVYSGSIDEANDVTEFFSVEKAEGSNYLVVTAKDEALTATGFDFYGDSEHGNNIIVVFPVHIDQKEGEEIFKNEEMQQHNGHLKKLSVHEYVYEFLNGDDTTNTKTFTTIDNLLKVKNNAEGNTTKPDVRYTNSVKTQLEVAIPKISKEADRFEWEVGEKVKYTVTMKNDNPHSIMDRVTITDDDLPDALQLDKEDANAICVYAKGATENFSAPDDSTKIPATRGVLEKKDAGSITGKVTKDEIWAKGSWNPANAEEITGQCEVTYLNDQGKTGNGFTVMIPKQYRGETITITFLCEVTEAYNNCDFETGNCVNGSVVENTARGYASLMLANEEVKDSERIWINTPHLSIEKINGTFKYENKKFVRIDEDETNYKKGDSVHYSLLIQNEHPGTLARDILVTDQIETDGLSFDGNSVKVFKIYTNAKGQQVKTDVTRMIAPEDLQVALDNKSMSIRTDFTLRYDGEIPFATVIAENVHNRGYELGTMEDGKVPGLKRINPEEKEGESTWKIVPSDYETAALSGKSTMNEWESIRTVVSHPQEWKDAEIAYIVEYDAIISQGVSAGEILRNTAEVDAENANKTNDPHMITGKAPSIIIEKSSDKLEYEVGQTGHYVLKVNNHTDETVAKNVVIKDELANKEAKTLPDSVKVIFYEKRGDYKYDFKEFKTVGGTDITGSCMMPESANDEGKIYINTGKDLDHNGMIVVTYDVKFDSAALVNDTVPNVSATKADNAYPELKESTTFTETEDGLQIRKTSDKTNGMVVTNGETITYTIEVKNNTAKDRNNVLVKDKIPDLTTYVDGSAVVLKDGGKAKTITMDEEEYVAFILPVLHAYETKKVQFKVTVDDEAGDDDIIRNIGAVMVANPEAAPKGEDVPDELFEAEGFIDTNVTLHPLSNWAVDDNVVSIIGNPVTPDKSADKETYYVGEKITYKVTLSNNAKTTPVKDLFLDDSVEENGVIAIIPDSFNIVLDGQDITGSCAIRVNEDGLGYHIDFNRDLAAGSKVVVTYKADALKEADKVTNTAIFNGDEKLKAWEDVKIEDPALRITKDVDHNDLLLGEEAHYEVIVTEPTDRGIIKNLVIEDALEEAGLIMIKEDSIKVFWNGQEISDCIITVTDGSSGYGIQTGRDLTTKDTVKITYTGIPTEKAVEFCKNTENHKIDNIAKAYGDGTEEVQDAAFVKVTDADNSLKVVKSSDKTVYSLTTEEMKEHGIMDIAHYTVDVSNEKDGVARKVVISDAFEMQGMEIVEGSIKVSHKDGKGTTDITSDCSITVGEDKNSYEIQTGKDLGLNDHITVTYDVIYTDRNLVGKDIVNIVTATDENGDEGRDDNTVTVKVPELTPEKEADKEVYAVGETAHYTIKVSQDKEDITAYNVVVKDEIITEMEGYSIKEDSIVIKDKAGKDITKEILANEDGIKVEKDSMEIHTHKHLTTGEFFTVEYDIVLDQPEMAGKALNNIVKVKADNAPEVSADEYVNIPDGDGLLGEKTSDPVNGSTVKIPASDQEGNVIHDEEGRVTYTNDEITYTIKITNTTDSDKSHVLVRDQIPVSTEFISSEDGEVKQLAGNDYFTAVIDTIAAGESKEVSFKVKVTADGYAQIKNVAEYKPSDSPEINFEDGKWTDTNEVVHYVPEVVTVDNGKNPVLKIEKSSDKSEYAIGETGKYTLVITNEREGTVAENVSIKDMFEDKNVKIKKDIITVTGPDGTVYDHDKLVFDKDDEVVYGFSLATGLNLEHGKQIKVTYDVVFDSKDLMGKDLINNAIAKADNTEEAHAKNTVTIKDDKKVNKTEKDPDRKQSIKEGKNNDDSGGKNGYTGNVKTSDMLILVLIVAVVGIVSASVFWMRKRKQK